MTDFGLENGVENWTKFYITKIGRKNASDLIQH